MLDLLHFRCDRVREGRGWYGDSDSGDKLDDLKQEGGRSWKQKSDRSWKQKSDRFEADL